MNKDHPDDYRLLVEPNEAYMRMFMMLEAFEEAAQDDRWLPEPKSDADDEAWENYFEEFDRQLTNAKRIPLMEYIGNPQVMPLASVPPAKLEFELERLLDILAANNVYIDFLGQVDIVEAYRFITEELLNEIVDDIRIEGMNQHFIYEEFYPDDVDWYDDDWGENDDDLLFSN